MDFWDFFLFFSLSNEPSNTLSLFRQIYHRPNCLNKHRWEHTRQWREASNFVLSKHRQVQLLKAAAILLFMGKDPTSLPETGELDPEVEGGGEFGDVHLAPPPPHVLGHGSVGRGGIQRSSNRA